VDWFEEKEARREADRYAARKEEYMRKDLIDDDKADYDWNHGKRVYMDD